MRAEPLALALGELAVGGQRRPPACAAAENAARAAEAGAGSAEQPGVLEQLEVLEGSHVSSFDVLN
jgi:hypothetical protein